MWGGGSSLGGVFRGSRNGSCIAHSRPRVYQRGPRETPDTDLFFRRSVLFCDGLVSPSPIAVRDLRATDTLNAGGALSKHTLTVLYSLVPVLFPFHP